MARFALNSFDLPTVGRRELFSFVFFTLPSFISRILSSMYLISEYSIDGIYDTIVPLLGHSPGFVVRREAVDQGLLPRDPTEHRSSE